MKTQMRALIAIAVLLLGIGLGGCEDPEAMKANETAEKLVGTWLREIEVSGAKAPRILVLGPDGKFSESLVADFADGRKRKEERSGEWTFDGKNLKRRYTHEDGRIIGNYNFVTFELTSLSAREFQGKNHVQGEEIHYQRVAEGTEP
ncbi:MAG: hypothetical protein H7255_01405 [Ramlibacter sp.]|nr:hypothetical protein [Ramlibacter sp.]